MKFKIGDVVKVKVKGTLNGREGTIINIMRPYYDVYIDNSFQVGAVLKPKSWLLFDEEIVLVRSIKEEDLM